MAGFLFQALSLVVAFVFAALLFAAIYIIVPNKPVKLREVWKGTLVAAVLLVLYETLFPIYEGHFLRPGNLGPLVGFVIVIGIFFYYLAFILLLGAEVNSWAAGQRETAGPIDAILHELQAHNTTRGVAGPTAGQPQEDLQNFEGAAAMHDTPSAIHHERMEHTDDAQPPKYAESGVTDHGYRLTDDEQSGKQQEQTGIPLGLLAQGEDAPGAAPVFHSGALVAPEHSVMYSKTLRERRRRQALNPPLTPRQRTTAAALAASAVIVLTGVVRFLGRLVAGRDERPPAAD